MGLLWALDVDDLGAGFVEKSTVVSILIFLQEKNYLLLKIIMILFVVEKKKDLVKLLTVKGVITLIVGEDGINNYFLDFLDFLFFLVFRFPPRKGVVVIIVAVSLTPDGDTTTILIV
jgi:hypothetical protein